MKVNICITIQTILESIGRMIIIFLFGLQLELYNMTIFGKILLLIGIMIFFTNPLIIVKFQKTGEGKQ